MAREQFIHDLWKADRHLAPAQVEADSPYRGVLAVAKLLQRADLWLTPRVVDSYRPEDFSDLPPERQEELRLAVEGFRQVVASVSPRAPATPEQAQQGREHLEKVISALREGLLREWGAALEKLVGDAETWSSRQEWGTKRDPKQLQEPLLGSYTAPRLLIHTLDGRLLLDPITRFAVGVEGLVELCVIPSFDSVRITRGESGWDIHPDSPDEPSRKWSEEAFVNTVRELLRRQ